MFNELLKLQQVNGGTKLFLRSNNKVPTVEQNSSKIGTIKFQII